MRASSLCVSLVVMACQYIVVAVLLCLSGITPTPVLFGGRRQVDANSKAVKDALAFALYEYNKGSNDMYQARSMKVNKAETQLVSGVKYYLDVDIGRTQCKKPTTDVNSCEFHLDPKLAKVSTCHFEVYTIPWIGTTKLMTSSCN